MGALGILAWIGLLIAGTPLPFLLALITALFSFVPFIGPIAAAAPAFLVGLSAGPHVAFVTLIAYLIVQILENNIVTPLIQKRITNIPPVVSIAAQLFFGVLAGVFGLLLATPVAVVFIVFVQTLYIRETLAGKRSGYSGNRSVIRMRRFFNSARVRRFCTPFAVFRLWFQCRA